MAYELIVFLQGDDYHEFEATLYPESTPQDLYKGFLMGTPDKKAALTYLTQWDFGEPGDNTNDPAEPWGSNDEVYRRIRESYVMTWNTGLSYAALYRVVKAPQRS